MTPNPSLYENYKRYVSKPEECRVCSQSSTCTARRRKSLDQRFVLRSLDQDLFDEVRNQMQEPAFIDRASERMWKCEGLFAEAKQNHNLSRAKYRGTSKVQIQAYFTAIVQNLKRLLFPFYCWLVAIRCITQSVQCLHRSNEQSNEPRTPQKKIRQYFFNRPGGLMRQNGV